jgi:hypothetical protein
MFLLSLTATCQVWTVSLKAGLFTYKPTLSTLSGRNLIKTADLFSKQAEDFDLHIVEAFDEIMNLTLYRHADAVNAFQQLEHPT